MADDDSVQEELDLDDDGGSESDRAVSRRLAVVLSAAESAVTLVSLALIIYAKQWALATLGVSDSVVVTIANWCFNISVGGTLLVVLISDLLRMWRGVESRWQAARD